MAKIVRGLRRYLWVVLTLLPALLLAAPRPTRADGSGNGPGQAAGPPTGGGQNLCESGDKAGPTAVDQKLPCAKCDPPPPPVIAPADTPAMGAAMACVTEPGANALAAISDVASRGQGKHFDGVERQAFATTDFPGNSDGILSPHTGALSLTVGIESATGPVRPPDT